MKILEYKTLNGCGGKIDIHEIASIFWEFSIYDQPERGIWIRFKNSDHTLSINDPDGAIYKLISDNFK